MKLQRIVSPYNINSRYAKSHWFVGTRQRTLTTARERREHGQQLRNRRLR